jgi:hypothetical protein
MSEFAVYNANQVAVIAGGKSLDSGRGDDEFVSIAKQEDDATYKGGVDGSGTVSVSNNTYHEVTITMLHTAKGNAILSGLYKAALATGQRLAVVPLAVTDIGSSGDLFVCAEAWIKKFPDEARAKETGTVQWVFGCHNPQRFIAGH